MTISQTSLTNWAAGGENSISLNGLVNLFANYKKENSSWDNTLDIGYGVIKQYKSGEYKDRNWIKSDDKLDFASKYGQKASKDWYYAAMVNFKSQMTPGFVYSGDTMRTRISDFFAPAYLLGAIGMDYKPSDNFTLFLAPFTSKTTFVMDDSLSDAGAFGVDPGANIRSEIGGYIKTFYKVDIMKNISFQTKLELFSNYLENPQNVDVNWENLIAMKVNKFVSVNLTTHLIYDHDVLITDGDGNQGPRTQFKEVFGVGFSYRF